MPKERKYYQRRALGSTRVDLPLKKKQQFLKKIITFGESYKKVSEDYKMGLGSTCQDWEALAKDNIQKMETNRTSYIRFELCWKLFSTQLQTN